MLVAGIPESPRFLLLMKRRWECIEVLDEMAELNGVPLPTESSLRDVPPHPKIHPFRQVLGPSLFARTSLPLWVMFFWLNYASYGNVMWIKAYFGRMDMDNIERDVYVSMSAGRIVGVISVALLIDWIPRRMTLRMMFFLAGLFTFISVMVHGGKEVSNQFIQINVKKTTVLALFTLAAFFEEASWGAIYTYSVEVYPSSVRSTGSGLAMAVGRLGGIVSTSIGRKLMEEDPRLPFYMTAFAFLLAAVAAIVIKIETQGAKLADV